MADIRDPAAGWDALWHTVIFDITVIGVLFALLAAWFIFRYRRRPDRSRAALKLSVAAAVARWLPTFVFI
jgi:hypothetical protein